MIARALSLLGLMKRSEHEAMKHKRPSGRHSDCAARDLDCAKVAQRILDKIDAALTPSALSGDAGEGE